MAPLNKTILAGMFACTNSGLGLDTGVLLRLLQTPPKIVSEATYYFCEQYCESENDLAMFGEEAEMWADKLKDMDDDTIRTLHFERIALYDEIAAMVKGN